MEQLENKPMTTEDYREKYREYKKKIERKTCTIKELAEILDISVAKARRIVHIEGAPVLRFGRDYRIILSKLDEFLENNIGAVL